MDSVPDPAVSAEHAALTLESLPSRLLRSGPLPFEPIPSMPLSTKSLPSETFSFKFLPTMPLPFPDDQFCAAPLPSFPDSPDSRGMPDRVGEGDGLFLGQHPANQDCGAIGAEGEALQTVLNVSKLLLSERDATAFCNGVKRKWVGSDDLHQSKRAALANSDAAPVNASTVNRGFSCVGDGLEGHRQETEQEDDVLIVSVADPERGGCLKVEGQASIGNESVEDDSTVLPLACGTIPNTSTLICDTDSVEEVPLVIGSTSNEANDIVSSSGDRGLNQLQGEDLSSSASVVMSNIFLCEADDGNSVQDCDTAVNSVHAANGAEIKPERIENSCDECKHCDEAKSSVGNCVKTDGDAGVEAVVLNTSSVLSVVEVALASCDSNLVNETVILEDTTMSDRHMCKVGDITDGLERASVDQVLMSDMREGGADSTAASEEEIGDNECCAINVLNAEFDVAGRCEKKNDFMEVCVAGNDVREAVDAENCVTKSWALDKDVTESCDKKNDVAEQRNGKNYVMKKFNAKNDGREKLDVRNDAAEKLDAENHDTKKLHVENGATENIDTENDATRKFNAKNYVAERHNMKNDAPNNNKYLLTACDAENDLENSSGVENNYEETRNAKNDLKVAGDAVKNLKKTADVKNNSDETDVTEISRETADAENVSKISLPSEEIAPPLCENSTCEPIVEAAIVDKESDIEVLLLSQGTQIFCPTEVHPEAEKSVLYGEGVFSTDGLLSGEAVLSGDGLLSGENEAMVAEKPALNIGALLLEVGDEVIEIMKAVDAESNSGDAGSSSEVDETRIQRVDTKCEASSSARSNTQANKFDGDTSLDNKKADGLNSAAVNCAPRKQSDIENVDLVGLDMKQAPTAVHSDRGTRTARRSGLRASARRSRGHSRASFVGARGVARQSRAYDIFGLDEDDAIAVPSEEEMDGCQRQRGRPRRYLGHCGSTAPRKWKMDGAQLNRDQILIGEDMEEGMDEDKPMRPRGPGGPRGRPRRASGGFSDTAPQNLSSNIDDAMQADDCVESHRVVALLMSDILTQVVAKSLYATWYSDDAVSCHDDAISCHDDAISMLDIIDDESSDIDSCRNVGSPISSVSRDTLPPPSSPGVSDTSVGSSPPASPRPHTLPGPGHRPSPGSGLRPGLRPSTRPSPKHSPRARAGPRLSPGSKARRLSLVPAGPVNHNANKTGIDLTLTCEEYPPPLNGVCPRTTTSNMLGSGDGGRSRRDFQDAVTVVDDNSESQASTIIEVRIADTTNNKRVKPSAGAPAAVKPAATTLHPVVAAVPVPRVRAVDLLVDLANTLVSTRVFKDLIAVQRGRLEATGTAASDYDRALLGRLENMHQELVTKGRPLRPGPAPRCRCGFVCGSAGVLEWHREGGLAAGGKGRRRCCLCKRGVAGGAEAGGSRGAGETYGDSRFAHHMALVHGRACRARTDPPAEFACTLCPYETGSLRKFIQHRRKCTLEFIPGRNLEPSLADRSTFGLVAPRPTHTSPISSSVVSQGPLVFYPAPRLGLFHPARLGALPPPTLPVSLPPSSPMPPALPTRPPLSAPSPLALLTTEAVQISKTWMQPPRPPFSVPEVSLLQPRALPRPLYRAPVRLVSTPQHGFYSPPTVVNPGSVPNELFPPSGSSDVPTSCFQAAPPPQGLSSSSPAVSLMFRQAALSAACSILSCPSVSASLPGPGNTPLSLPGPGNPPLSLPVGGTVPLSQLGSSSLPGSAISSLLICPLCYGFVKDAAIMAVHMRVCHPASGGPIDRPVCTQCVPPLEFLDKAALRRHMRSNSHSMGAAVMSGIMSPGMLPNGMLPTGMMSAGMLPTGMVPTGILPTGMLPTGMLPTGMLPNGMPHSSMLSPGMLPSGMLPAAASAVPLPVIKCWFCSASVRGCTLEHMTTAHRLSLWVMLQRSRCYLCPLPLASTAQLEQHMISIHSALFPSLEALWTAVQRAVPPVEVARAGLESAVAYGSSRCPRCSDVFVNLGYLFRHFYTRHHGAAASEQSRSYACRLCKRVGVGKVFAGAEAYTEHMRQAHTRACTVALLRAEGGREPAAKKRDGAKGFAVKQSAVAPNINAIFGVPDTHRGSRNLIGLNKPIVIIPRMTMAFGTPQSVTRVSAVASPRGVPAVTPRGVPSIPAVTPRGVPSVLAVSRTEPRADMTPRHIGRMSTGVTLGSVTLVPSGIVGRPVGRLVRVSQTSSAGSAGPSKHLGPVIVIDDNDKPKTKTIVWKNPRVLICRKLRCGGVGITCKRLHHHALQRRHGPPNSTQRPPSKMGPKSRVQPLSGLASPSALRPSGRLVRLDLPVDDDSSNEVSQALHGSSKVGQVQGSQRVSRSFDVGRPAAGADPKRKSGAADLCSLRTIAARRSGHSANSSPSASSALNKGKQPLSKPGSGKFSWPLADNSRSKKPALSPRKSFGDTAAQKRTSGARAPQNSGPGFRGRPRKTSVENRGDCVRPVVKNGVFVIAPMSDSDEEDDGSDSADVPDVTGQGVSSVYIDVDGDDNGTAALSGIQAHYSMGTYETIVID